jgi:hypothetical protein
MGLAPPGRFFLKVVVFVPIQVAILARGLL